MVAEMSLLERCCQGRGRGLDRARKHQLVDKTTEGIPLTHVYMFQRGGIVLDYEDNCTSDDVEQSIRNLRSIPWLIQLHHRSMNPLVRLKRINPSH